MKKIFITGCAKTGTTLVRRLFNSFDLIVYNRNEISLSQFIHSKHNVGKRSINEIFSNTLNENQIKQSLKLIKNNNIIIVNVTRDKENVLKSSNGYVSEKRYDDSMAQSKKYSSYINYTIEYEKLLFDPDLMQKDISNQLNLKILHKWSEYPNFINVNEENFKSKNYTLRPIGKPYIK